MNKIELKLLTLLSCAVLLVTSEQITICEEAYHRGYCKDYSINSRSACVDFNFVNDEIGSVNTHGNSFRLYKRQNCAGNAHSFLPGSRNHNDVAALGFNNRIYKSFQICRLSNDFYLDIQGDA